MCHISRFYATNTTSKKQFSLTYYKYFFNFNASVTVRLCPLCNSIQVYDFPEIKVKYFKVEEIDKFLIHFQGTKNAFPELQDYHRYYNSTLFHSAVVGQVLLLMC